MLRISLFIFAFYGFLSSGFAQLTEVKAKITDNLPVYNQTVLGKKSATNPKKCGMDTLEYARRKTTSYFSISSRKNYSLGQIYYAPQDITVHGFTFYAWSLDTSGKPVRLICNIYKAGTDLLPSGNPLQSDTVTVDTVFGGGLLTTLEKRANFKTPVTVNFPYIITVESDSAAVSVGMVSNSWSNRDGDSANFFAGSVSGKWYRGLSLNISGTPLNADMQFYPHVSYKFGTDFVMPDCFEFKDTAKFKNDNQNNVSSSFFYSLYAFYNIDQFLHTWNYGDQPWNYTALNGANKYSGKGNFKVRLISTLYQWRGSSPCVDTTEKMLYFKPTNPKIVSNVNICRGNEANVEVESDTGTVIKWYKNPSASAKEVHTGTLYKLGKIQKNDTFYVKAINYDCESGYTQILLTVNDYPNHPSIKNDSICNNAKANLQAKSSLGVTDWYTDSSFLAFYTGDVLQTGSLTKNITYFVRSNNNGCYSPYFKSVSAFVDANFAPAEPIVSNDTTICLRPLGKATLKAYSSDTIRWFLTPSGGTSIARGNTYTFNPSKTGISILYVESQKSVCASSRLPIQINVSDYPSIKQVFNDERCKGDTLQIGALLSDFGNINWYTTATGGISFNKGTVIKYFTNVTKNVYAEAEANGCINPIRSLVNAKINAYDSITKIDAPVVCGNAKVTLKVTAGTSTIRWYEDELATKLLATSAAFTTPQLLVTTNYYFVVEKNGCKSPINSVTAEVLPLPVAGYNFSFLPGHKLSLVPQSTSGVSYKWDLGDGTILTSKYVTYKYTKYGTFNVKLVVKSLASGCRDSTSQDITYDFSGIKPLVKTSTISIYPNPTVQGFKISLSPELIGGKMSIYSLDGKLIYQKAVIEQSVIEVSDHFNTGTYFIRVETNTKTAVEKLIVR
jgi:hypothetical protein